MSENYWHGLSGKYGVIYADPPWHFSSRAPEGEGFNKRLPYQTMRPAEICAMPVHDIMDTHCVLFMWTTSAHLPVALDVIKAWGFNYSTIAFVWRKMHASGGLEAITLGQWTLGGSEICLLGSTPGSHSAMRIGQDRSVRQVVSAERTVHSGKPGEVRDRISRMFAPETRKVELFARQRAEGWDAWGEQCPESDP